MNDIQKALSEFASRNKVVVDFFSDMYGVNVRARYKTDEGVEHGYVVEVGRKRDDGLPHTIASATEEAILILLQAAT